MTNKEVIIDLLRKFPQGLSIEELSLRGKMNRVTVRVILEGLLGENLITQRHIGQVKINYWNVKKESKK